VVDRAHPEQGSGLTRSLEIGSAIPSHNRHCFGCGIDNANGLRMKMTVASPDTVQGTFVVREAHQGAPGLIHGGILAAAFDEILGAVNWLVGAPAVTGKLETNFLKPVPVDSVVEMSAWVDRVEGRKVFLFGDARVGDGLEVARASGIFVQVPLEHFAKHGRPQDVAEAIGRGSRAWLD
jgi:acyl-coenzyme A thioesterase PaaI-like protein